MVRHFPRTQNSRGYISNSTQPLRARNGLRRIIHLRLKRGSSISSKMGSTDVDVYCIPSQEIDPENFWQVIGYISEWRARGQVAQ
jgi:hypothetical protein